MQRKSRKQQKKRQIPNPAGRSGTPVSLYPLSFQEAVEGLAAVKLPEHKGKQPEAHPKKGQ